MQQTSDGRVRVSATDAANAARCGRRIHLDRDVALGRIARPERIDPTADLFAAKGIAHEADVLAALEAAHGPAVRVPTAGGDPDRIAAAEKATAEAMAAGAALIYQAVFIGPIRRGSPDFLIRVDDDRSPTGWSYEPADAKLARRPAAEHLTQLGCYCLDVAAAQGLAPRSAHLIGGDGTTHTLPADDLTDDAAIASLRAWGIANIPAQTLEPTPSGMCRLCPWADACEDRMTETATLLALRPHRSTATRLAAAGITTLTDLDTNDGNPVPGVAAKTLTDLTARARQRLTSPDPTITLTDPTPVRDLPAPDPADLYVDFEGTPLGPDGNHLEYLLGVHHHDTHLRFWGHDHDGEAAAFAAFVAHAAAVLAANPGAHLYHYGTYEVTALRRLAAAHGHTTLTETVIGRSVDLYATARSSLRSSHNRLGLKHLERFYRDTERCTGVADGANSIVAYHQWSTNPDSRRDDTLADIAAYNEDDCRSLRDLRSWLDRLAT